MKRLWLVRVERKLCDGCARGEHEKCEPIPVSVDEMGVGRESTAYYECRCVCPWMGQLPKERFA